MSFTKYIILDDIVKANKLKRNLSKLCLPNDNTSTKYIVELHIHHLNGKVAVSVPKGLKMIYKKDNHIEVRKALKRSLNVLNIDSNVLDNLKHRQRINISRVLFKNLDTYTSKQLRNRNFFPPETLPVL